MMIKSQNKPTATAVGGGLGGAAAAIVVIFLPDFGVEMEADKAAMVTAALSTIFGFIVRYLPEPKN